MNKNVTMAIDDDLLKKARKIAVDQNTTLSGLFKSYLNDLVERKTKNKDSVVKELCDLFDQSDVVVGDKTWTRDDLHER